MKALFVTSRAPRHQAIAMQSAPDFLDITMLDTPDKASILANISDVDILISERSGVVDQDMISAGKNLKLIQRLGRFSHDINLEAAQSANIAVCTMPLLVSTLVSEHVLMQILALAKTTREAGFSIHQHRDDDKPQKCDENHFAYNWTDRRGMRSLTDATVGIVGLGEIGADVARRLAPFGARVLYHKRSQLPTAVERGLNIQFATLDQIRAESDFLCLLLPHGPAMGGSINAEYIARMKPGANLISTGASTVLNEQNVADAMRSGQLAGIAVDGFVYEPAPLDSPLLQLANEMPKGNIILTPHIAGGLSSNDVAARALEFENIRRLHNGDTLLHRAV